MFTDQNTYQPKMLATGDAAKALNVTPQTVRDWTDAGKLPAVLTDGGHRKYRDDDVAFLALAERGITTYWIDDVVIKMDGEFSVTVIGQGLIPYVHSNPEEVELERFRKFHNGLERLPRLLALTGQPVINMPDIAETFRNEDNDLMVQTYLSVASLDRVECSRLLNEHIPQAVAWLRAQVKPIIGVAQWVTSTGEQVRSAY